jgi:Na+/proline symporter
MFNIFGRRARTVRAMAGYLSLVGAGELIAITQLGYDNGWGVLWFVSGLTVGYCFLSVTSEKMRIVAASRGINTLSGYFSDQFGAPAGVAITIVSVISLGSLLTIQFILGSDLVQALTGISAWIISIIMAAIIISYLLSAGFVAVLSTDVLRAIMMTTALLILIGLVAAQALENSLKFELYTALPIPDALVLFVLAFFGAISAADIWQTIFASADRAVVRRSMVSAGISFFIIGILIAQIGMIAKSMLTQPAPETTILISAAQVIFSGALAPLVTLLIVGSVMSTADTEIWVISALLASNVYPSEAMVVQRAPKTSTHFQNELRRLNRFAIPLVTVAAVVFGYVFHDALALFQGLLILLTTIGPVVLGAMFFSPPRQAVLLALWSGLTTFAFLEIVYALAVPTNYIALIPMAVSFGCMLASPMFPTRAS